MAVAQVGISPVAQLKAAALFCGQNINARSSQPVQVILAQLRIDDMEGLLAALKAFLDERQQDPILFVWAVKEGTDMTFCAEHGAGEPDWLVAVTGSFSKNVGLGAIRGILRLGSDELGMAD